MCCTTHETVKSTLKSQLTENVQMCLKFNIDK